MIDDRQLVTESCNGNRNAFRSLVERYKEKVYYMAYDLTGNAADAEDMTQEVFIKAYQSLEGFRGDARFSSWLYRITVNTCHDQRRKRWWKIRKSQSADDAYRNGPDSLPSANPGPDQTADQTLIQSCLQSALRQLSDRERDIFVLRYHHDLPLKEIADALHISTGTVKSTLFTAIRKLRSILSPLKHELEWEATP